MTRDRKESPVERANPVRMWLVLKAQKVNPVSLVRPVTPAPMVKTQSMVSPVMRVRRDPLENRLV